MADHHRVAQLAGAENAGQRLAEPASSQTTVAGTPQTGRSTPGGRRRGASPRRRTPPTCEEGGGDACRQGEAHAACSQIAARRPSRRRAVRATARSPVEGGACPRSLGRGRPARPAQGLGHASPPQGEGVLAGALADGRARGLRPGKAARPPSVFVGDDGQGRRVEQPVGSSRRRRQQRRRSARSRTPARARRTAARTVVAFVAFRPVRHTSAFGTRRRRATPPTSPPPGRRRRRGGHRRRWAG